MRIALHSSEIGEKFADLYNVEKEKVRVLEVQLEKAKSLVTSFRRKLNHEEIAKSTGALSTKREFKNTIRNLKIDNEKLEKKNTQLKLELEILQDQFFLHDDFANKRY